MPTRKIKKVTFETVRELALALPGVEEGPCFGTPAFRVRGKLLARLKEDGESLAIKVSFDEREMLLAADPASFYITPHYQNYPMMLVRLPAVDRAALAELIEQAWCSIAPKRLLAIRK